MRSNCRGLGTGCSRSRPLLGFALLVAVAAVALGLGSSVGLRVAAGNAVTHPAFVAPAPAPAPGPQQIQAAYGQLPLIFEANQGQSDPRVKFLARGNGYGLFLATGEVVLALRAGRPQDSRRDAGPTNADATNIVRMRLARADSAARIIGADALPGKSNYFIGNDPAKWHRNVPQFARVRYENVYPGIDLVYYGNQGQLEYDFEVGPGADPQQVGLRFQGPDRLKLDATGDLVLALRGGDVRMHAPRIYQKVADEQRPIPGRFVLRAGNQVGFEVGAYDRTRTLVIDPVLTYSTYLGGSDKEGCFLITGVVTPGCPAIAVDLGSSAYVAGSTMSTDFPPQPGVLGSLTGIANIFVTKFNLAGSATVFSTYLGGTGRDTSAGIVVDSGFNVIVTGTTNADDFPTNGSNAAFQPARLSSGDHVFVSKLDATGATLLYSTYLSGPDGTDHASGLALDSRGRAYVIGTTSSSDFPHTLGAFQTAPCCDPSPATKQFFISKVDPALSGMASLAYSTYFGGGNPTDGLALGGGIALDNSSNVYITGGTTFQNTGNSPHNGGGTDFPILNAFQSCLNGPTNPSPCPSSPATDAFVAKLDLTKTSDAQLIYSTYLGGIGAETGFGIAVDTGGNAYVTGSTASMDIVIPSPTATFQPCLDVSTVPPPSPCPARTLPDAFVAKINNAASAAVSLTYFSYLGGAGNDVGLAIAVDALQGARVTGWTDSTDFHTQTPFSPNPGAGTHAFVARIDTTATSATAAGHYSSYLGGTGADRGTSIAIDSQSASYVTGETTSADFPRVNPFQNVFGGLSDAFVSKLGPIVNLDITATATPLVVGVGNPVTFKFVITNNGDLTNGVTFTDTVPSGFTFVPSGSCGTLTGTTVTCNVGALSAGASSTQNVILTPSVDGMPGDSGTVNVLGSTFPGKSASTNVTVNDFMVDVDPPAAPPVPAGAVATYTVTVTPLGTGKIPSAVSLSCSSGLPTGATCSFTGTNPIPNLNTGAQSRVLNIGTTVRTTTTSGLWRQSTPLYALWLPVSGLALLGAGIGRKKSRKRPVLLGLLLGGFLGLVLFQAGCGSSSTTPPTTSGTPAGTYTITVTATSGAARTKTLELVVQ